MGAGVLMIVQGGVEDNGTRRYGENSPRSPLRLGVAAL